MKPETLAVTKDLVERVLSGGASYRAAGQALRLGRSTVERNIKSLIRQVAREKGIAEWVDHYEQRVALWTELLRDQGDAHAQRAKIYARDHRHMASSAAYPTPWP